MLVGVVADTHIPRRASRIPPELLAGLGGVDLILHAGDLVEESVLVELGRVAPVVAVAGNVDPPQLQRKLGRQRVLRLGRFRIGLVHGDGDAGTTPLRARAAFTAVDGVVFGHSHEPHNRWEGGVLLFNPGSPTDARRARAPSYGLLRIGAELSGEIVFF